MAMVTNTTTNNIVTNNAIITTTGFYVSHNKLSQILNGRFGELLSKLVISIPQWKGPDKCMRLFDFITINGKRFVRFPRTLIPKIARLIDIRDELPPIKIANIEFTGTLLPDQVTIVDHLVNSAISDTTVTATNDATVTVTSSVTVTATSSATVTSGVTVTATSSVTNRINSVLLKLEAGRGKTFIAAALVARLKLRTLYIVPKRPLMKQTADVLRTTTSAKVAIWGKTAIAEKLIAESDITVMVITSACKQSPDFFASYSMIILDEAHMYCTDTRMSIFNMMSHFILGLSATIDERPETAMLKKYFNETHDADASVAEIIPNTPATDTTNVPFNGVVRVIRYRAGLEYNRNRTHESTGEIFVKYMHDQAISDPQRMAIIEHETMELYNDGHNIYIFAEEIEHLRAVQEVVKGAFIPEIHMFTGQMSSAEIENATADARILCTTYGFGGTGISINRMTAIVFATPRKSNMKQIIARILRRGSTSNRTRIVVDILDIATCMQHQFKKRLLAYKHYNFKLKYINGNELATNNNC